MSIPLSDSQIVELSQTLHYAREDIFAIEPLTKTFQDFSLTDAYKIQKQGIQLRVQEGEEVVGYKMGFTSKAKMEQMGLHQPIFGMLTAQMYVENKGQYPIEDQIHPKAEPEIYFITQKELSGAITPEQALQACSKIGVALEILDSRYQGFKYFTLPDVIADNASSSHYVLGEFIRPPYNLDLSHLKIELKQDGKVLFEAPSSAIMGNPLLSLCELVSLLHERGEKLPAGSIVLAGAATQAVELKRGVKMSAELENVGRVEFNVI